MRPVSGGRLVPSGGMTFSPREVPMIPLSWREWLKRSLLGSSRPDRAGRGAGGRRIRPPTLERLEDRLTPSANLDIVGGALTYTGSAVNNSLTVSAAGTAPTALYTFTDAGE